jgi:hypothetical protein
MIDRSILLRFGAVFAIVLFIEANIWLSGFAFADITLWAPGVDMIKSGALPDLWSVLPVHPGATFLFGSALVAQTGVSAFLAMKIFMALAMAVGVTLISYLCYSLRPASYWWLLAATAIAPYVVMLDMTPPSALAAILSAIYALLLLKIRESPESDNLLALLGICAGALAATRFDAGGLLLLVSLPYIWTLVRERCIVILCFAGLYFGALNPFFWINPIEHLASAIGQALTNQHSPVGYQYHKHALILASISALLAFAFAYLKPKATSVPRDFLLWLLGASALMCGAIMLSSYHPVRYFFPTIILWEVFLPLFMLEFAGAVFQRLRPAWLSVEFAIFLWLFLDRFPPALYMIVQNIAPRGLQLWQ